MLYDLTENLYHDAYSSSLNVMIFFKKHDNHHILSTQVREKHLAILVPELGVSS